METLNLIPTQAYTVTFDVGELWSEQLDGGEPRVRVNKVGAVHEVAVQWLCTEAEYQYLHSFKRLRAGRGALPFKMSLVLDEGLELAQARFVPDTFRLIAVEGLLYTVGAMLWVTKLNDHTTSYDNTFLMFFDHYGDGTLLFFERLAKFANEDVLVLNTI